MRRETDISQWHYSAAQAVEILYARYARIYQDRVTRNYFLIAPDGKTVLMVEESGLSEIARTVLYSEALGAS